MKPNHFPILLAVVGFSAILIAIWFVGANNPTFFAQSNVQSVLESAKSNPKATVSLDAALSCSSGKTLRDREDCYDAFARQLLETKSTPEAMKFLVDSSEKNSTFRLLCHDIAHSVGRISFENLGTIEKTFSVCSQDCHSGCYHGAMEQFFREDANLLQGENDDPHALFFAMQNSVKIACVNVDGAHTEKFQCLHGLGHAVDYFSDNNLLQALSLCDALETDYDRQSCYGGTFMENVVSVNKETRWINSIDPQFPCDAVDSKYRYQCYLMQTSVMSELFNGNTTQIISSCKLAGEHATTCYISFGRDQSNLARVNDPTPFADLKTIDVNYRINYVQGLLYAVIDNTWDGKYAFAFCSKLDDSVYAKKDCFQIAVNYLKNVIRQPNELISINCETYGTEKELCERVLDSAA